MKKILTAITIGLLCFSMFSMLAPQTKATGLPPVGHWRFDEGTGTVASDSSGNGNTGSLMNGPQWVSGISGMALSFDGSDDSVPIPHSSSLDISGDQMSIEYWMKPTVDLPISGVYMDIFDKGDSYVGQVLPNGKIVFALPISPNSRDIYSTTDFWSSGKWYHLAFTYDGNEMRLYVNGVLENTATATGNVRSSSLQLSIGSHHAGQPPFFKGVLDEFAIYDYARTAEEILGDYEAIGPIYIRSDGSIDPPTAHITTLDNITYTLTSNITSNGDGIIVQRDNIVMNGNECTLQGSGSGKGLNLSGVSNVTIENIGVKLFVCGVFLGSSSDNSVCRSNMTNNDGYGILLLTSSQCNSILSNNIVNSTYGILVQDSCNSNAISNNSVAECWKGIFIERSYNNSAFRNSATSNGFGFYLQECSDNVVSDNNVTYNDYGILLEYSSNNNVSGNSMTANNWDGIRLEYSSVHNSVSGNNMTSNGYGILIGSGSDYNNVNGNSIANNSYGSWLELSSGNIFWHNNFFSNTNQVYINLWSVNAWDDGYPSGGNYWSDHVCTGNPSTGSQPYIIDDDNIDHYPFEDPSGWLVSAKAADLSLSSPHICFSDSNPSVGQTVNITATVNNLGDDNAENVMVQFYDGTTPISQQQISLISHNSYGTAFTEWTALGEGYHLIKVVVDPDDNITETDETNNMATRSILVGKHTGYGGIIVVGNLSTYETLPGSFINVYGHASYNTTYGAGEPVAGATVTITVLGDAGQWTTHTINTGDYSQQITTPYYAGNYTVVVTVSDGTFSESINLPLAVLQPPEGVDLTLSPTDISFSPPDPLENDNVTVTAAIHNIGSLNSTNVTVGFFINGGLIANRTVDFIPAQGTVSTSTWWIFTSGTNGVTVKADLDNSTEELNEDNNQASRSLYVYQASPDPTPSNIYFSDNTPVVNQSITITAEVKNIGGLNVSNLIVAFYEDDNPIGEGTIPYVPGKGGTASTSLNHSFANEGSHTIKVQVDPYQSISEADENNNNYSRNINVHLPSPDLTLSRSDITFSENEPFNGSEITIYAVVHNIGELDAESVVVQFLDGNIEISLDTVPLIENGSYETVNNTRTAMSPGLHSIKVRIDPNNAINESDESNNVAIRSIYVYPPREQQVPDLAIYETDIVFSNTNPPPSENVTIYATIHNIGEELAENVSVVFYVEDVQIGPVQTIMSLLADGNETLSTSWISSGIGSHVVKVEVDPGYFIIESDKSNNVATRAIIVGKHDVAITDVVPSKTVVGQGFSLNINVTVMNRGDFTENFNVTAYANTTAIATFTDITLTSGNSTTLDFTWNTAGFAKGNYTISAVADTVPGETDTEDNNCPGGSILITKVGDLGGGVPPAFFDCDDSVDGKDLALFLRCYTGTAPAEAMYLGDLGGGVPPQFYDCDGKVDGKDLALFLRCYTGLGP